MTMRLARDAYKQMIAEDVAWLMACQPSLERDHILAILQCSESREYDRPPAPVAEIREPTDDECRNIWREAKANEGDGSKVCAGRAMFDAVRAVLWPKEGL